MARQVVQVHELGRLLVEEAREVLRDPRVADGVARQRIPLGEVVDDQADAGAVVEELGGLAPLPDLVGHARVDAHLAAFGLADGQAARVGLGTRAVPGRPAVHDVHDPPRYAVGRGRVPRPQRLRHALARLAERVVLHEGGDARQVLGMRLGQRAHGRPRQPGTRRAEAPLPRVVDERRVVQHVQEARLGRAHAEVVLLAVAEAEELLVERADRAQHGAADQHAHADRGGQPRVGAAGDGRDQPAERVRVEAGGQGVHLERARQRGERGVVGEGRDGRDGAVGVRRRLHLLHPARGHLGVAVQQDHVPVRSGHAAVGADHEAAAPRVLEDQEGIGRRRQLDRGPRLALSGAVEHHHDAVEREIRVAQERGQAAAELGVREVDGHDHVEGRRLAQGARYRPRFSAPAGSSGGFRDRPIGLVSAGRGTSRRGLARGANTSCHW